MEKAAIIGLKKRMPAWLARPERRRIKHRSNVEAFRYERIRDDIAGKIRRGQLKAGARLPSEPALARRFSVNHLTVRRALDLLQQDGVISREQGRGTFVIDQAAKKSGILYIGEMDTHGHQEQFIALQARATERNCRLAGIDPHRTRTGDWRGLARAQLAETDVLVVAGAFYADVEGLLTQYHNGLIILGASKPELKRPACYVLYDRRMAVDLAVGHLASLGHRRIALLCSHAPARDTASDHRVLHHAYYAALAAQNIRNYELYVSIPNADPKFDEQNMATIKSVLNAKHPPTAFVCESDYKARVLYSAAHVLKLSIPRDFSIVGMHDTPWCEAWSPQLSSVSFCPEETAEIVMALSLAKPSERHIVCRVEPQLIKRASVSALDNAG